MNLDWGNIALAVAALVGLVVWVINFCCASHAETSVPNQQTHSFGQTNGINGREARVRDLEKRLAVIRSSAHLLLENRETDEVKRELCRFIIEEAEELSSSFSRV